MSYTPHTWQTGETVTAEKLNALEQGVASGGGAPVMRINAVIDWSGETPTATVDKTFAEIKAHLDGGGFCFLIDDMYNTYTLIETTTLGGVLNSFGFGFVQLYNVGEMLGTTIFINSDGTVSVRSVFPD